MRVILELVSGPQAGRRIHLLRNQSVQVGNTSWSDFVVRDDQQMAGQHFALETDYGSCRLRNLAGGGATQLNGQAVTELTLLRSGDQIVAGSSTFSIQIEGGDATTAPSEPPTLARTSNVAAVPTGKAPVSTKAPPAERLFHKEACDSGAWHYFGSTENFPPGELAAQLAALWPLHLMADFRRAKIAPPESAATAPILFDWLGPNGRLCSPVILSPELAPQAAELLQDGWGQDGLVGLFTTQPTADVIAHLRRSVRLGSDRVVGICWPAILGQILAHYREEFVRRVLGIMAAVLVEGGENGAEWNLYSLAPLDETLLAFGFKLAVPEEAVAE